MKRSFFRLGNILLPGALLVGAGGLALVFLACHAAGWRACTGVLGAAYPARDVALLGLAYVAVYLAFVLVAPILALGAVGTFLLCRLVERGRCGVGGRPPR